MRGVAPAVIALGLLGACAGSAPSPGEAARQACERARTVRPIGEPGEDKYEAESGEIEAWAEALELAAKSAAMAASEDSDYEGLSGHVSASRDDFAHMRDVLADGGAVVGDELTAIQERVTALVEACKQV